MVSLRLVVFFLCAAILTSSISCITPVDRPEKDEYGCQPPAPDVFEKVGIDVDTALELPGTITTKLKVGVEPEIITLVSKAVKDQEMLAYLRCLCMKRDGATLNQSAWLQLIAAIPPEEIVQWVAANPWPGEPLKPRKVRQRLLGFGDLVAGKTSWGADWEADRDYELARVEVLNGPAVWRLEGATSYNGSGRTFCSSGTDWSKGALVWEKGWWPKLCAEDGATLKGGVALRFYFYDSE